MTDKSNLVPVERFPRATYNPNYPTKRLRVTNYQFEQIAYVEVPDLDRIHHSDWEAVIPDEMSRQWETIKREFQVAATNWARAVFARDLDPSTRFKDHMRGMLPYGERYAQEHGGDDNL